MSHTLFKSENSSRFGRGGPSHDPNGLSSRLKIVIRGAVQGVGFRPFIFRLAEELQLTGWVNNSPQGVFIEVEGDRRRLESFLRRLDLEKPPHSFIQSLESSWLDAVGCPKFEIRESENAGGKSALVLPDIGTCPECLRDILDPANRRFRYPFTNCTHCGPRFSIIEALPYDRSNTSMKQFTMCPACQSEYNDPRNRRFHAQPNACPVCGPRLELWSAQGEAIFGADRALKAAAHQIKRGQILAIKGVGGFHLMADARNEKSVHLLRERKHREEKPFALMFPSLPAVKLHCEVSPIEERLLRSPEAPIVLLKKIANRQSPIVNAVAPGNPNLGAMLPSNPLHYLLMLELDFPVVATSGNLSDEPICTDEHEALERLRGIADAFLVHNRPIVRHEDDSIVRVMLDREMVLRRARGYAPLPIHLPVMADKTVLAVGAHLKNSVALAVDDNVFISQHIGDLETETANAAFRQVVEDLPRLYGTQPEVIATDLHPDYLSTKYALERRAPSRQEADNVVDEHAGAVPGAPRVVQIQHHIAHVLSCIAENEVKLPALGVAWDGTGYGTDGTVWGGEFFRVTDNVVERVAHLRPFRLPGGDKAVKEPRRIALGLLYELYGEAAFEMEHLPPLREIRPVEMITLRGMLQRRVNSPFTSSVGRLFDAVASLINLRHQTRFEGQAAMELEFALEDFETNEAYSLRIAAHSAERQLNSSIVNRHSPFILDWSQMIGAILSDVYGGVPIGIVSAKFHNALAEAVVMIARKLGEQRVVLSGGCFQNRYLTERMVKRLNEEKYKPYWHQRMPPNDGGVALGQVVAAFREQVVNHQS